MVKMMVARLGRFLIILVGVLTHLACLIHVQLFFSLDSAPKEDQRVTFRTMAAKVCHFVLNFADEE